MDGSSLYRIPSEAILHTILTWPISKHACSKRRKATPDSPSRVCCQKTLELKIKERNSENGWRLRSIVLRQTRMTHATHNKSCNQTSSKYVWLPSDLLVMRESGFSLRVWLAVLASISYITSLDYPPSRKPYALDLTSTSGQCYVHWPCALKMSLPTKQLSNTLLVEYRNIIRFTPISPTRNPPRIYLFADSTSIFCHALTSRNQCSGDYQGTNSSINPLDHLWQTLQTTDNMWYRQKAHMSLDDGGGTKQLTPHAVCPLLEATGLDSKGRKRCSRNRRIMHRASNPTRRSFHVHRARTRQQCTPAFLFHALLGMELKQGVIIHW
jgi:hypothetical protein